MPGCKSELEVAVLRPRESTCCILRKPFPLTVNCRNVGHMHWGGGSNIIRQFSSLPAKIGTLSERRLHVAAGDESGLGRSLPLVLRRVVGARQPDKIYEN